MHILSRIWTTFRGLFSKQVRRFEWRSPEAVLDREIERNRDALERLDGDLAGLRDAREEQARLLEADLRELEETEEALHAAVTARDETRGPELLMRRDRSRKMACEREGELRRTDDDIREVRADYQRAARRLQYLQIDKQRLITQIRVLQSLHEIDRIRMLIHAQDASTLSSLRERVEQERRRREIDKRLQPSSALSGAQAGIRACHQFRILCTTAAEPRRLPDEREMRVP